MAIRFDPKALRYRAASGRFVKREAVTRALDKAREEVKGRLKTLGEQLRDGKINRAQFAISFKDELRALHLLAGGIASGGRAQLSPALLGRIGSDTKGQYGYANNLVRELMNGQTRIDARFFARLSLYAEASRGTFAESERRLYRNAGYDEERNVLSASESCEGCLAEAGKGWVAIGTLTRIGGRICRSNDRCSLTYRRAA